MKITKANAEYSGGGIYIYTGEFDDGTYFMTSDDMPDDILVLDADPMESSDDCFYADWQIEHLVDEINDISVTINAIDWILVNEPGGNYRNCDLEERKDEMKKEG